MTLDMESNVCVAGNYDREVKMPLRTASTDTFDNPRYKHDEFDLEEK